MVKSGQVVVRQFTTESPYTRSAVNADAPPTAILHVGGVPHAAVVTVTNPSAALYSASVTIPELADLTPVSLVASATVEGVSSKGVIWEDVVDARLDAIDELALESTALAAAASSASADSSLNAQRLAIIDGAAQELSATANKEEILAAMPPSVLGTGDKQVRLTIKNTDGATVADAEVTVSTDEAGEVPEAGPVTTDAVGRTPVLLLSSGTYYRWASKSGETFSNPQSFTVV